MQLAAAGHQVTSVDSSAGRLRRLAENLARTHLDAQRIEANVLDWAPGHAFDGILLDAPCSATGTFRRHPEVLYRARPQVIAQCAKEQARLLDRACAWLKPGGALIYSVCSLERMEGEDIISRFLEQRSDFIINAPRELPSFVPIAPEGWVRILPGLLEDEGGLDGFFIARLVRTG